MPESEWWSDLGQGGRFWRLPSTVLDDRWPDAIRMVNLRGLADTGALALPPLLVLVGANGSGKSTFARFFPLLKQSVETATRGPVLWYQQDLVDFGSFHDAVRRKPDGSRESHIEFHFSLKPFNIELHLTGDRRETRLARVRVQAANGDLATLDFDVAGQLSRFGVGDQLEVLSTTGMVPWSADFSGIVPDIRMEESDNLPLYTDAVATALSWVFHQNTAEDSRIAFARRLHYATDLRPQFNEAGFGKKWAKNTSKFFTNVGEVARIRHMLFARMVPDLLRLTAAWLDGFARGVAYIGPFRATPQRFYRQQDLAVDVIDPKGSNLAMFLRSLSYDDTLSLNSWLRDLFSFTVSVDADGSQDAINLQFVDKRSYNVVDTGFGFSQLLPVLVQLWAMAFQEIQARPRVPLSVVVVEQPELHLHPHQQALFARALAAAVKTRRARLVIETHSEAIVSELGAAIVSEGLSPDDVNVLCFEPDAALMATRVRVATYDSGGGLQNWPSGFFLP